MSAINELPKVRHQREEPAQANGGPRVQVVIVSWNNLDLLEECFASVYAQTYTDWGIILVDNGSADATVAYVKKHHPRVHLIETGANLGFAVANNIGIKKAFESTACDYVMLLNTDACTREDWLEVMVAFADKTPNGALYQSPTVDYYDHKIYDSIGITMSQSALATQIGYREKHLKLETMKVFGVNAAAALYSRRYLDSQPFGEDYFDHDFFMYLEDVDIAMRAVMLGWDNYMVAGTVAYHMGSASSGKNPGFSLYMTYRNNWPVLVKNLPARIIWRTIPGMLRAEFARLRAFTREGRFKLVWALIKGRSLSLAKMPVFLAKRRVMKRLWKIDPEVLWKLMEIPKLERIPATNGPFGEEKVSIVVLGFNSAETLDACLRSIEAQTYTNYQLYFVDNASTDNTARAVSEGYPSVHLLPQSANLGKANGYNVGMTAALQRESPDYIALIDASVTLDKHWLKETVRALRGEELGFAVGSRILQDKAEYYGYSYQPGKFPVALNKPPLAGTVAGVAEGAMLVRAEFLGPVGLMDGEFFDGCAETDWCLRASLMCYTTHVAASATATNHTVLTSELASRRWYQEHKNVPYMYLRTTPLKLMAKSLPSAMAGAIRTALEGLTGGYASSVMKIAIKLVLRTPRILHSRRRINARRRVASAQHETYLNSIR